METKAQSYLNSVSMQRSAKHNGGTVKAWDVVHEYSFWVCLALCFVLLLSFLVVFGALPCLQGTPAATARWFITSGLPAFCRHVTISKGCTQKEDGRPGHSL